MVTHLHGARRDKHHRLQAQDRPAPAAETVYNIAPNSPIRMLLGVSSFPAPHTGRGGFCCIFCLRIGMGITVKTLNF